MGTPVLGNRVTQPIDHLDLFDAPPGVKLVRLVCQEFTSLCPVTGQPDFSEIEITYAPKDKCIESKSLKLFLWQYREKGAFAEALSAELAESIQQMTEAFFVRVTVHQNPRGGIAIQSIAEAGVEPDD